MDINTIIDGKYKITSLIGKGGTSVVYKAINTNLGTEWAIKVINKDDKENDDNDLLVEPNLLKKLQHPSLPRIVDIVESKNKFLIIEDFIDGTSLQNLLAQVGKFPEEKVLKWAKELSEVLKYLHGQKPNPIIYRDMKPGNIMLTKEGNIKLIDFGIAREYKENVSSDTTYLGTRGYAAPEQYGTHQTDERSDIYSLGVTLYHLITGKGPDEPPFEIMPVRTLNPNLSEGIEHIILKATKTDPNQRYLNINELLYDFENIEKLSSKYKKEKRQIKIKVASFALSFIFFNSLIISGSYSIRAEQIDQYLQTISLAQKTVENMGVEDGVEVFKEAIDKFPKRDEAYLSLATSYIDNIQYDKALGLLQKEAPQKNKNINKNEEYSYLLGLCLFSKNNYEGAKEEFLKVKNMKFEGLHEYLLISEIMSKPEAPKADELVDTMDSFKAYVDKLENMDRKISGYIMLSDFYRDNPNIYENGVDLQIEILEKAISQGQAKNNIKMYERLASAYYRKGNTLSGVGTSDEAIKFYKKALQNYNLVISLGYESLDIYMGIADCYTVLGDNSNCESILLKLIEKYPNDINAYAKLGLLYSKIENTKPVSGRDYSRVREYYNKVKDMPGADTNTQVTMLKRIVETL